MNRNIKAFTFLELIIVMTIIIIVSVLGISGFLSYREYVQLESTYSDFLTSIKLQRNKAVNTVAYNIPGEINLSVDVPDFYAVYANQSTFTLYFCNKIGSTQYANCQEDLDANKLIVPSSIQFTGNCGIIAFAKGSGDIYSINATAIPSAGGSGVFEDIPSTNTCSLNVSNIKTPFFKTLNVDYEKDTF